jgi:hypothetical protein
MFGWFKSKPKPEETEAYKLGQRFVQAVNTDLERFMTTRFDSAFTGYLKILSDGFDAVYERADAPPITLARIDFKVFNGRDLSPFEEATMPSFDHFQQELRAQINRAIQRGATQLVVNSAELHRAVGDFPARMQHCCDAMKAEMKPGDSVMGECAHDGLTVRYLLPHMS